MQQFQAFSSVIEFLFSLFLSLTSLKNNIMLSRRIFLIQSLTSALSAVGASSLHRQSAQAVEKKATHLKTLFVKFNVFNDKLIVHVQLENKRYVYLLSKKADFMINQLEKLYLDLESTNSSKFTIIDRIQWLGQQILLPLDSLIEQCQAINFIIPQNCLRCPFDILQHGKLPLFLQKPVIYSFSKVNSSLKFSEDWSALVISDQTADPENGAAFVQDILANSVYYDIQDLTLEKLSLIPPKDLVLISAHGSIYSNLSHQQDHIDLNQDSILPTHLSRLSPKLIYLDSCQLGVSYEFIQSLKNAKTQYYIAPILSNEAGNSSTRTIQLFFKFLKAGFSPTLALFHTRTQLYQHFQKMDGYTLLMWRAFPFRVYHLN